jgi:hypothetical protein
VGRFYEVTILGIRPTKRKDGLAAAAFLRVAFGPFASQKMFQ